MPLRTVERSRPRLAREGRRTEAFEALAAATGAKVHSLARRILGHEQDAEELTQQTFFSASEQLEGLREGSSFSTWLRVATHAAQRPVLEASGRGV